MPRLASMLLNGTFAATPLDRKSLPRSRLDIARRVRTNPFPWTGQFSPQLVEALLEAYAPDSGAVLDPFVGSGTSLGEAARFGLSAYGSELNPAALVLSRVHELINIDVSQRVDILKHIEDQLSQAIGAAYGPLFRSASARTLDRDESEAALVRVWRDSAPGPSKVLTAALVVLCDFHQTHLDADKIHKLWYRLAKTVRELPESELPVIVHHADARSLPIETDSIDFVVTSPPYINVFNYHQQFRRSVEALDWDVLAVARSEIGSNRQNRGNRFLTVIQYCLDMVLALRETERVTKPDGKLILVLGRESSVRGTPFFNGELVAELAVRSVGLGLDRRQERVFRNRFGVDIYEDILHFRAVRGNATEDSCLAAARCIAREALSAAGSLAPRKERAGLEQAIGRVEDVSPSPVLNSPPVASAAA